jgi:hypothetical protein
MIRIGTVPIPQPTDDGIAPLKVQKRQYDIFDGWFDDKYIDDVFHHGLNSKPISFSDISKA